ncbi:MAG: VOC family protein [Chloroflexi bacterium]|nr:VOC family protein [Chloroflexota bacterium]
MAHTIVHFEIPGDDVPRLQEFYRGLFGWQIAPAGMPGVDYWLITTVGEGEQGVNGGMMVRQQPGQPITIYISVESVNESSARAAALGGTILHPPAPIPGVGHFAFIQDPQGNVFGLFQDDPQAQ